MDLNVEDVRAGAGDRRISRRTLLTRGGALAGTLVSSSALAGLLSACGADGTGARTDGAARSLTRIARLSAAITGEPDLLDPQKSSLYAASQVYDHVFSKLLTMDARGGFVPRLATRWRLEDERTWVFDLRDDVTFHNGERFTADDVRYTFERLLAKSTASSYAQNFATLDEVEVLAPDRVAFHLSEPFAPFLTVLANNGQIVKRKAIEQRGSGRRPVGTGPFVFVEWARGDHIRLRRNPDYFERRVPYADELTFRIQPSSPQRVEAVRAGELDWIDAVPPESLVSVRDDPALRLVTANTGGLPQFLMFNTTRPPLDNTALRQAIAWTIDREQIRKVAFLGAGETGSEEVPTGSPWYDGRDPYRRGPDLERARELMRRSGLRDVRITFSAWTAAPYPAKVGEVMREQLKQIGVELEVRRVEISVWLEELFAKKYELTIGFNERTIDPDNFYSLILRSGSAQNVTGYENREFDRLIDRARAEQDEARRRELYAQARQRVFADVPVLFVHYDTMHYLMRSEIGGSEVRPNLELGLQYVGSLQ